MIDPCRNKTILLQNYSQLIFVRFNFQLKFVSSCILWFILHYWFFMLLILLHLSLRRARLDKTVKTPETTNKKHGMLEEVPLTSWARLLSGMLLRPIPCRLCEKKMLAWSGKFPILWLSYFHVQLVRIRGVKLCGAEHPCHLTKRDQRSTGHWRLIWIIRIQSSSHQASQFDGVLYQKMMTQIWEVLW